MKDAGSKRSGAGDEAEGSDNDLDSDEEAMLASYEDESLVDTVLSRLESIIDRLYRLSFRIRNPTTRLGISKASKYRDVDETTEVDLIDMLAEADRRHIRELLKQISGSSIDDDNDHYLVSRLSQANTLRRKQLGQWRRHRRKLKEPSQPRQNPMPKKDTNEPRSPPELANAHNLQSLLSPGDKELSRPSTATMIVDRHIDLDDDKSIVSTSTYNQLHNYDATEVYMPPPPNIPSHRKEFECPYCYILCSRRMLKKESWGYVLAAH